jgi:ubiquinone/menaquinone biosynthesis C-methylase UbiE
VTAPHIARDYDAFHADHPLLELDQTWVAQQLRPLANVPDRTVIDLGCGTGRSILPLAAQGWRAVGLDLSSEMLQAAREKAKAQSISIELHQGNMVELDAFPNQWAHAALCLYSSIGMIRYRAFRRQFLAHVARILRRDGVFLVHVHNRGAWLGMPGGIRDTVVGWWREKTTRQWELGDRVYPYRGLPSMFLHIYSRRELWKDLVESGFSRVTYHFLNATSSQWLRFPWLLPHFRSGGYLVAASKA